MSAKTPQPVIDAIGRLTLEGLSAPEIASRLDIGLRTIVRYRDELGIRGTHKGNQPDPFVDEMAVVRAMDGDRVRCTPYETREAVRRLTEQGMSSTWIANRLGITRRSVTRHRSANNERAVA